MDALIATVQAWLAPLSAHGERLAGAAGQAAAGLNLTGLIALAAALGWASGLRLYLVVFVTGMAGTLGWVTLPAGLQVLQHPLLLGASAFMLFVEFFADKIPGLDSLWDAVHSLIRIPAGAALAAGVFGADSSTMALVAALLGGSLAATSAATKAATRAAINTSPEPFSNVAASLSEDGMVLGAMWLSVQHPLLFGVALVLVLVLSVLLLIAMLRFLKAVLARIARLFGREPVSV